METIGKIRRGHRIERVGISQIARRLGASRNTVNKCLKGEVTAPKYKGRPTRLPVMESGMTPNVLDEFGADHWRKRRGFKKNPRLRVTAHIRRPEFRVSISLSERLRSRPRAVRSAHLLGTG